MSSNNVKIDIDMPYTAEVAPVMYGIMSPHFPRFFPGRDLVAQPVLIKELIDGVIIPLTKECPFELDSADSSNEFTEEMIGDIYRDFFPDLIIYEGIFHFRTEEQMSFCKLKYF